ncbi:MAG: hypothetical protein RIS97_1636 [Pseudomonadota bacterium]
MTQQHGHREQVQIVILPQLAHFAQWRREFLAYGLFAKLVISRALFSIFNVA